MHHLAINIPLVMGGREQLRNLRSVKKNQVLYLIIGCIASFIVSQEIAKRGKPYTDGEYIKLFYKYIWRAIPEF